MKASTRRTVALALCDAIIWMQVDASKEWGRAIRNEAAGITDDGEALQFSLQAFVGMLPFTLSSRLLAIWAALRTSHLIGSQAQTLQLGNTGIKPRGIAIACGTTAVLLGSVYLLGARAPKTYIAVNLCALLVGISSFAFAGRFGPTDRRSISLGMLLLGILLLWSMSIGISVDGMTRWLSIGPLVIQPSLMVLPPMMVAYARNPSATSIAAVLITVATLAMQPDKTMLAAAALSVLSTAIARRSAATAGTAILAIGAAVHARSQPCELRGAPFVDDVLYSSFETHIWLGIAVWVGCALIVLPALVGWWRDRAQRPAYLAFGATWMGVVLSAVTGNSPTPLVGYGGSAIVGYFLSVAALPGIAISTRQRRAPPDAVAATRNGDPASPRVFAGQSS